MDFTVAAFPAIDREFTDRFRILDSRTKCIAGIFTTTRIATRSMLLDCTDRILCQFSMKKAIATCSGVTVEHINLELYLHDETDAVSQPLKELVAYNEFFLLSALNQQRSVLQTLDKG